MASRSITYWAGKTGANKENENYLSYIRQTKYVHIHTDTDIMKQLPTVATKSLKRVRITKSEQSTNCQRIGGMIDALHQGHKLWYLGSYLSHGISLISKRQIYPLPFHWRTLIQGYRVTQCKNTVSAYLTIWCTYIYDSLKSGESLIPNMVTCT